MDAFEWNKIFGGLLASALALFVIREGVHTLFHEEPLETPGYAVAVPEESATPVAEAPTEQAQPLDITPLLASADPAAGQAVFKNCAACHSYEKGGANKVGPNLYGIVGADIAHIDGFAYSSAMAGREGQWTPQNLAEFLHGPKAWLPGTKMGFAGLKREQDIANIIAFLNSQSDAPAALN